MSTNLVGSVGTQTDISNTSAGDGTRGALLQDQFMRILLAQLRYQDPMSPMQEKDFFAQMAAFSTATEVETLSGKVDAALQLMTDRYAKEELMSATRLIGRRFEATSDLGAFSGVAEAIGLDGGMVIVKSGTRSFPLKDVTWVGGIADESDGV